MNQKLFTIFLLLIFQQTSALAQTQAKAELFFGQKIVSLSPPQGWDVLSKREETEFRPALLRIGSPDGVGQAAIYLQVFPRGNVTEQAYREAVRKFITKDMNGRIHGESELSVNSKDCWRISYEGNGPGFVDDNRQFLNTVFFTRERIFVVHCASMTDVWNDNKQDFLSISNSFLEKDRD